MNDRTLLPVADRERLQLADGQHVMLQRIGPEAKPLIAAAMARLSPETSRRRFFTPRLRLSDRELALLTDADGGRRFALGACRRGPDGTVEGVGMAHYVRTDDDARVAEVALTVVDAFQHRGLGKALLTRLGAAAFAQGIDRLRATMLPDNDPIIALFRKYLPGTRIFREGDHLAADIPLAPLLAAAPR